MTIETQLAPAGCFFTPEQSNAYYAARYARAGITCHWWGGGEGADRHDGIVSYFMEQGRQKVKSVNFVVSDNKVTMMVPDENVAWCSQAGNPTTISIEFQPTLGDQGYKNGGELIASLEKKYGHAMKLFKHSDWYSTSCPGTIDVARLRREADAAKGIIDIKPVSVTSTPAAASPVASANTVRLSGPTWAAYKVGSGHRKGTSDQVGSLLPDQYNQPTYAVIGWDGPDAVIIDTQSYGRVSIWVRDTDAQFNSAAVQAQSFGSGQTVTFPNTAGPWRVYAPGSQLRPNTSDEKGKLRPDLLGSQTYPIVEKHDNYVIIDTRDFGRVAAWIKDTPALIK